MVNIILINRELGHYRAISDRDLRFPCNHRTDEVNKFLYGLFIMVLSLRSIKPNNCLADNFKKHFTSMSCTPYPAIQSGDIDHHIDVYKDVQYQVNHRLYMPWTPTILDKIKWNSKLPSPPNQAWSRAKAKTRHFPIFDLGGERGGGLGFPFILSKIPASYARSLQENSQSERAYYCSHMIMNVHDFG